MSDKALENGAAEEPIGPSADDGPKNVPLLPFVRRCGTLVDWSLSWAQRAVGHGTDAEATGDGDALEAGPEPGDPPADVGDVRRLRRRDV